MSLVDAIGADVRQYNGTQEELSRRVCGSATGLRYKLANYRGMHFQPGELVMLQLLSGGRNTINAMAAELGGVYLQLPDVDAVLDGSDLEEEVERLQETIGELFREMREAKRDKVIDPDEKRALDRRGHHVVTQIKRYLALSYRIYGADLDAEA